MQSSPSPDHLFSQNTQKLYVFDTPDYSLNGG